MDTKEIFLYKKNDYFLGFFLLIFLKRTLKNEQSVNTVLFLLMTSASIILFLLLILVDPTTLCHFQPY